MIKTWKLKLIVAIAWWIYFISSNANISKEQQDILENAVKKINPNFNIADANVDAIPDTNLYKILSKLDSEVLYVSKEGRYFIYGDLIDLQEANKNDWNITDLSKRTITKSELDKFSTKNMIVFKPARNSWGIRKSIGFITVFTDLDCPYGSRLHKEVEKAVDSGLEVRYMMFPRAGVGSESYKKAVSVWCAKDHKKAFSMASNGEAVASLTCKNDPIENQFNLGRKIGIHATPSIVLKNGRIIPGYMTSDALISLVKEENAHFNS